ncbi:golgin subfamily A member 6-like protein 6 [Helianthus annuus]|uniref:golgin subfamily A member 6-like protein 6 n=1 Tax=Helianthus annuus TaxID=4232 RepID=UPI000B8F79C2|nr:golgin subfamily A member 6-like protein 6 [Helianthus annuus]
MENEFYNAFASPMTITQNAWEHTEVQYSRPVGDNRVKLPIRELSAEEKKKYKDEKMMVSLLQQAIKEDILILLQHNGSAHSIWTELEAKFLGSDEMLKNKNSLMKKEFDLFRGLRNENTKQIIERYCNLLKNMNRLGIKKDNDELVEKLADALPHDPYQQEQQQTAHARKVIEDSKKACLVNQDDGSSSKGFSWDKFISEEKKIRKHLNAEAEKKKKYEEEEKQMRQAEAEKKKKVEEEIQVRKVKEVPAFEIKTDADEKRAAREQKQMKSDNVAQEGETVQNEEDESVAEEITEVKHVVEAVKVVEVEKIIEVERIVEVIKPCSKCLESCINCAAKDEKLAELEKMKEQLLFNLNYVKESYDVQDYAGASRIYPIVEGMKTFEEEKTSEEKKSETKEDDEENHQKQKKSKWFRKQTNKEFLAKKQEEMMGSIDHLIAYNTTSTFS